MFFCYIDNEKLNRNNRLRWEYWYGPYVEWAFFVHPFSITFTPDGYLLSGMGLRKI